MAMCNQLTSLLFKGLNTRKEAAADYDVRKRRVALTFLPCELC